MSLTKVSYSMITGTPVNVLDLGAVADGNGVGGGTDCSAAIQAAIDAIVNSGVKGTVYIPSGTYRCDSGLTLDLSICSLKGEGSTLDFTNMTAASGGTYAELTANGFIGPATSGVALTVISGADGYAGGAYYENTNKVTGIRLKGKQGVSEGGTPPAPPNDQVGIYFYSPVGHTSINGAFENCVVSQFYTGVVFGQNEFGVTFRSCTLIFNGTAVIMPQVNNAGEKNVFESCTVYNNVNGFALNNAFATTRIINCSIGGSSELYIEIANGDLNVIGCHFEGNFAPDYPTAIVLWNPNTSFPNYSFITWVGNTVLAKSAHTYPLIYLEGAFEFAGYGGFIENSYVGSAAAFGGNGVGTFVCDGISVNRGTIPFESFGTSVTKRYYDIYNSNNVGNYISNSTYTPTLTGVSNITTVAAPEGLLYQKVNNVVTVWGYMAIDPAAAAGTATEFTISLPYASALTLNSDCSGTLTAWNASQVGAVHADVAGDKATVTFNCSDASSQNYSINFTYIVK